MNVELLWRYLNDITNSKHLRIVLGVENHVIQVVPSFLELRSPAHHSHILIEVLEVRWGRLHYFFTPQYTPRCAQVSWVAQVKHCASGEIRLGPCYVVKECLELLPTKTHLSRLLIQCSFHYTMLVDLWVGTSSLERLWIPACWQIHKNTWDYNPSISYTCQYNVIIKH